MNPIYAAQAAADDALPNGGVTADFSAETWWLTLIKAVFIVAFLIVSVMMALWVERRGLARMQTRLGPNVNGPFGLLQAIADAGKLIMRRTSGSRGPRRSSTSWPRSSPPSAPSWSTRSSLRAAGEHLRPLHASAADRLPGGGPLHPGHHRLRRLRHHPGRMVHALHLPASSAPCAAPLRSSPTS